MTEIDRALITKFVSKINDSYPAIYNDVSGRIFNTYAPLNTAFPYIVFYDISAISNDDFTHKHEEYIYQFSLFSVSTSSAEIGKMITDLTSLLDDCVLSVNGYAALPMKREIIRGIVRGEDKVWSSTIDYRIILRKVK